MKISYAFLTIFIIGSGVALAADKPASAIPKKAESTESSRESNRRAASETAAAIGALGANPTNRQISNVVFAAVRNSPENVLAIVHAATRVSPQSAAPAIVTAATAAVPDPWKSVTYHRIMTQPGKKAAHDFKGGSDGKHIVDLDGQTPGHGNGAGSPNPHGTSDGPLTLAEAIARTAFDAQPGLSFPELVSAVDVALNTDPSTLLRYVLSSRSISGVGDAGSSNVANEPLRRTLGGKIVPLPNPPVVSR